MTRVSIWRSTLHLGIVALLAALGGCSPAAEPNATGFIDLDMLTVERGQGVFQNNNDGVVTRILFAVDPAKLDAGKLHGSERIGKTTSGVIAVLDEYASPAAAGARCAAGRERVLRVFSLPRKRQLFEQLVASCASSRSAPEPVVSWLGSDRFRIAGPTPADYRIVGDNDVQRDN